MIEQDGYAPVSYNNTLYYAGIGGHKNVWSIRSESFSNPINIDLNGTTWLAQLYSKRIGKTLPPTQIDSSQLDFAVLGSHQSNLTKNFKFKPTIRLGYHNSLNTEGTEYGTVIEGSFEINNYSGFAVSGTGQLLQNQQIDTNNWGVSSKLDYDSNRDNLGTKIQINQLFGQIKDDSLETIVGNDKTSIDLNEHKHNNQYQIETKLSYGIVIGDSIGILTPSTNINFVNSNLHKIQIASQITLGNSLEFSLTSAQNYEAYETTDNQFKFKAKIVW